MKRSFTISLVLASMLVTVDAKELKSNNMEERLKALESKLDAANAEIQALKNQSKSDNSGSSDVTAKIEKLETKLAEVKAHDAFDNIKFSADFRTAVDYLNYKYNDYKYKDANGNTVDMSGKELSNDSLITSRLYLDMKAQPSEKLTFHGQLAAYAIWGGDRKLQADEH